MGQQNIPKLKYSEKRTENMETHFHRHTKIYKQEGLSIQYGLTYNDEKNIYKVPNVHHWGIV